MKLYTLFIYVTMVHSISLSKLKCFIGNNSILPIPTNFSTNLPPIETIELPPLFPNNTLEPTTLEPTTLEPTTLEPTSSKSTSPSIPPIITNETTYCNSSIQCTSNQSCEYDNLLNSTICKSNIECVTFEGNIYCSKAINYSYITYYYFILLLVYFL